MPANTAPIFGLVADAKTISASAAIAYSDASTPRSGNTANITAGAHVTVLTAGANGTRIDRIVFEATATTLAGQLLLFINDGSTNWFFKELTITAVTASTTVASSTVELIRTDGLPLLAIPSGYSLKAAITVTPTSGVINITAYGSDF